MLVRFWGTRGSRPCPGNSTLRYGGNTSCVEIRTSAGTLIILDGGSGICELGKALETEFGDQQIRGNLLISHTHWDHIQGLPFFSPLFNENNAWGIYGPRGAGASLEEILSGQMQYEYFPVTMARQRAEIEYCELTEGVFSIDNVRVTTRYLNHSALTLGYRLDADDSSIVYVADHEPHHRALANGIQSLKTEDLRHAQFLLGADILIHDAQFTAAEYAERIGWGHSTVEYAVDLAVRASVKTLVLFHHDPERSDNDVDRLVLLARDRARQQYPASDLTIIAAQEGGQLEVADSSPSAIVTRSHASGGATETGLASIFAVTDNADVRRHLNDAALELGCHFQSVQTFADFDDQFPSEAPTVLLCHTALPDICDQMERLRELAPHCVIVFIRDVDQQIWCANDVQGFVCDWIPWPCSPAYLRTRISAWSARLNRRWTPKTDPWVAFGTKDSGGHLPVSPLP